MIKAFLYDNVTGKVYHGLFTGVDCLGNGQWMNITRGEEPFSINQVVYGNSGHSLRVLTTDDKPISSKLFTKVLACNIKTYCEKYSSLSRFLCNMKDYGIEWNKDHLPLEFAIVQNDNAEFGFRIQTLGPNQDYIETVMGFDNVNDLLECIRKFIFILEKYAEIPVSYKRIQINKEIKKKTKRPYLMMFDDVEVRKD